MKRKDPTQGSDTCQKQGSSPTKERKQQMFEITSTSGSTINNITNQGWSWRPPARIKQTNQTYLREYYNTSSDTWNFTEKTEEVTATGQYIDVAKNPAEERYHIFVTNQTKKTSNGSSYFEIQHWTADYTDLNGTRERKIRPTLQLKYVLAARADSNNTIRSFIDVSAQSVWGKKIFLSYVILEEKPGDNLTATLYRRFWNGTGWSTAESIHSTPNEFGNNILVNVTKVQDLSIYYNRQRNTTIANFLARLKGVKEREHSQNVLTFLRRWRECNQPM